MLEVEKQRRTLELQAKLAGESAEVLIRSHCTRQSTGGNHPGAPFYALAPDIARELPIVAEAIEYLTLCGRIIPHARRATWFQVKGMEA